MRHRLPLVLTFLFCGHMIAFDGAVENGLTAFAHKNYATALTNFKKAAKQGNADAQYYLGSMYRLGQGAKRDSKQAAFWYRKAVDQGHAQAQLDLGFAYNFGYGVPQDRVKAVKLYKGAAEQGLVDAQLKLAVMYEQGWGTREEFKACLLLDQEGCRARRSCGSRWSCKGLLFWPWHSTKLSIGIGMVSQSSRDRGSQTRSFYLV